MKKILLASTILVGTAGFAAAENANFTFSGEAYMGMGYSTGFREGPAFDDINGDGVPTVYGAMFRPEVTASFTADMMTTTDGGLEAGTSITIDAGGASFESDYTERRFGYWSTSGSSISDASGYLSGDWGKLEVAYDADGINNAGPDGVYGPPLTLWGADDVTSWDVTLTYSNTWGDFDVEAYYTVALPGVFGSTNGDLGVMGTYNFGDYSVYVDYDFDNSSGNPHTVGFGGSASMSGFTAEVNLDYNVGAATPLSWDAAAGYATGPYSVGVQIASDGAPGGPFDYGATASYDLGGGVSIDGQFMHDATQNNNLATLGVSMAF